MIKSPQELIKSNDENSWRQGLSELLSQRRDSSIPSVVALLSDPVWRKRESAAKTLVEWGPDVIPVLLTALDETRPDEFYWALFVIGHFESPEAKSIVVGFLSNPYPEIRSYAVRSVGICKSLVNARRLFPLLSDENWSIRKLVFEQLLDFRDLLIDDLRQMVFSPDSEPCHPVVALLVKLGGEGILTELGRLYKTGSFAIRYSIITSLGEEKSPRAVDFVISGLSDQSWVIRKKASELLVAMGEGVFERLSARFGSGDSLMKHQIVHIIVRLLGPRALPLVRRLLGSPDHEYRILAIDCLRVIPGDESVRLLIQSLADQHRIVSDYASECLSVKPNLNISLLLEQLSTEDENVRFLVIKTVGSIGGLAMAPIIKILTSGNKQEKLFLLGVLQRISPDDALIDTLIKLLNDPAWPIRSSAAKCLISYGETSVPKVVRVLNDPSEDIQFWAKRVILTIGTSAVKTLTRILAEGTDSFLLPHIVSALLRMEHADAVPAVIKFLEANDDDRIEGVLSDISEIASREIVDTIMNLLTHPDERILKWLSYLLRKVKKQALRRIVLLGLGHANVMCRFFTAEAVKHWQALTENDLKSLLRQLEVESSKNVVRSVVSILGNHPLPNVVEALKEHLSGADPDFMLDLMKIIAESERPQFCAMIGQMLKKRSEVIRIEDVERVGKILGLIYKSKPEGLVQGLSSPSMAFRLCCVVALGEISDRRIVFSVMDNLAVREDPVVVKRAVKMLVRHFFSEDFRLKGAVTDYLLNLGTVITEPLEEEIQNLENEIDKKALVDLIESVGGTVDPAVLRRKGEQKIVLSDNHLDEVLERRKVAMEELEKYDQIIQQSHTINLAVMFTDVKGFTAFSSKASLSSVMSMLKEHDDILVPIFEKHGGQVLKKIGDSFMVVFDNVSKALLSAIESQRSLREHNNDSPEERKLAIRIALNYGSVIRRENDVFGDTVNLASRLEGIGDAFEIVVSESIVAHADKSIFDFMSAGEHTLKGIDHPVKAWKLNW